MLLPWMKKENRKNRGRIRASSIMEHNVFSIGLALILLLFSSASQWLLPTDLQGHRSRIDTTGFFLCRNGSGLECAS